jgi:hypothetical protein
VCVLDAFQFLVRTNNRRDLNRSQRAAIAVEAEDLIAELKAEAKAAQAKFHGNQYTEKSGLPELIPEVQKTDPEQNKARTQLAQTFNTNPPESLPSPVRLQADPPGLSGGVVYPTQPKPT